MTNFTPSTPISPSHPFPLPGFPCSQLPFPTHNNIGFQKAKIHFWVWEEEGRHGARWNKKPVSKPPINPWKTNRRARRNPRNATQEKQDMKIGFQLLLGERYRSINKQLNRPWNHHQLPAFPKTNGMLFRKPTPIQPKTIERAGPILLLFSQIIFSYIYCAETGAFVHRIA